MIDLKKYALDNAFWKYFFKVLSIPHPSGHEAALRDALAEEALAHGLIVRTDEAGNLAIDRPAAPGMAKAPRIILQGHLDMVPQAADGVKFDFEREAVEPFYEAGWITTAGRTTLGADDGVALAGAMELLTDRSLNCGALRAVFTVGEETGLLGASKIDPDFLDADYLLNLDSSEALTIGCAGGARIEGEAELASEAVPANHVGVRVHLSGYHGGHSGEDIDRPYGSANVTLRELLRAFPLLCPASVHGGTLDNALAVEAVLTGAIPAAELAALELYANEVSQKLNAELEAAAGAKICMDVEKTALPAAVLTAESSARFSQLLNDLPHGVLETLPAGDIASSCNLAILHGDAGQKWHVTLLARSLFNDKRDALVQTLRDAFTRAGFTHLLRSAYSSWSPDYDSALLALAKSVFREVNQLDAKVEVCRGGLETGFFAGVNPRLAMLSFAPEHINLHSPAERLNVASVERFRKFLRALIERAAELKNNSSTFQP